MLRLRKDVTFLIILLVILISFYFSNKRSGLTDAFSPRKVSNDTKVANKVFENSENKRKISLQFMIDDNKEFSSVLNDIVFIEGVTMKYSDTKDNFQQHILEIPKMEAQDVVTNLRKVKTLTKENIKTSPFSAFEANVEENIKNNIITKNRIQNMINRTTSPQSMANFRLQLDGVQTKIDSLNNLKTIQTHNTEYDLIYISAAKNIVGEGRLSKAVKNFFLNTILILLFMTLVLVIVYFFFIGMIKLMAVMGIKTIRGSSSNYNYGYNRGKKKIKRKYVSQEEAEIMQEEEKE